MIESSNNIEIKSPLTLTRRGKRVLGTVATLAVAGGLYLAHKGSENHGPEVPDKKYEQAYTEHGDPAEASIILEGKNVRFSPVVYEKGDDPKYDNVAITTDTYLGVAPVEYYNNPNDANGAWAGYRTEDVVDAAPGAERDALKKAFKTDKDGIVWVNIHEGTARFPE